MTDKPHWLRNFVALTKDTEIPDMFALWCGVGAISVALGRRVRIDMGLYDVFPNLFIVLVAGSGRCRKSTAIGVASKLVSKLVPRPNLISQKITPEALIEALGRTKEGKVRETCEGFVVVDELSNFLNRRTYEMGLAGLLITLYDCVETFRYHTKSRGVEEIKNSCLGMLAGSTIEWIKEAVPVDAVGAGLTSRIVFVYEKRPKEPRAWTEETEEAVGLKKELAYGLVRISKLRGTMRLTPGAREVYEEEYIRFYKTSPFFENRLLSGYASRRHTHMLKLGMVFSAGEGDSMEVEDRHLEGAIDMLKESESRMDEVLSLITSTEVGGMITSVGSMIRSAGSITRVKLMRRLSHQITALELNSIIMTLVQSGRVDVQVDGKGKQVYVSLR